MSIATSRQVPSNSKQLSNLSWQYKYSNLNTTCHIKPKCFFWTKLFKNLILVKYVTFVNVTLKVFSNKTAIFICLFIMCRTLFVYLLIYSFYIFILIIVLFCFSTILYVRIYLGMTMSQSSISRNRVTRLFFYFRVVQKDNHSIVSHLFRGFCKRKVSFHTSWVIILI